MLSIIIVNFKTADLIIEGLRSFYQYNTGIAHEIIVVSNDSSDADRIKVTESFPNITWIDMKYNAGFSRANNKGIRTSKGDLILLLNPDTLSVDDSISRCADALVDSPYVAAGVQQLDREGQTQLSGHLFMKGGINHLLPLPYWGGLLRTLGYWTGSKRPNVPQPKLIEEVDWISGAFLMVKSEAVQKALQ